jgi:hypothetical protein
MPLRVGVIDRSVECALHVIRPQAKILLRRRNTRIADDQPPPASRWSKETRRSGLFEMKSLSNRRCKENAGLINGPSDRAPPPNPEVNRCLELRWALHRARVGVVGRMAIALAETLIALEFTSRIMAFSSKLLQLSKDL